MHLSCSICAEVIGPSDDLEVTPCGHMFHTGCMGTWLSRSQTCPQCRFRCTTKSMVRLFLNVSANETLNEQDTQTLQSKLDAVQLKLRETTAALKKLDAESEKSKASQKMARKTIVSLEANLEKKEILLKSNAEVQKTLQMQTLLIPGLKKRLQDAQDELARVDSVQSLLRSTTAEVEEMLKNEHSVKSLATMVVMMKREVRSCKEKDDLRRRALIGAQSDLQKSRALEANLKEQIEILESDLSKMRNDAMEQARQHVNQPNRLNPTAKLNPPSPSPAVKESPRKESSSPYLKVSASSVGMLTKNRPRVARLAPYPTSTGSSRPTDNLTKFSIFNNARIAEPLTALPHSNRIFNGMGGTERRDLFVKKPSMH